MKKPPSREALMQRVADLEAELQARREDPGVSCSLDDFSLADIDHAADGVCVCHAIDRFPFFRFTFWNRRMVDLSGYGLEEINRKGWYQSVYPDLDVQAEAVARMTQMRGGVNLEAEEWEITRADGEKRTLRISTSVLEHGEGMPRVMAIMHDITQLKHTKAALDKKHQVLKKKLADADHALKSSDDRYRVLFENAGDAIFIHDLDGMVVAANPKALALFGYSQSEISSLKISMLHPTGALEK